MPCPPPTAAWHPPAPETSACCPIPSHTSVIEVLHRPVEPAQYTAAAFVDVCRRHGIQQSRGRVGSSYDNALAESFFQGLKREWLHGRSWTSKSQARLELFEWLSYFNRRRRHSALGYLTPVEFEQRLIASSTLSVAA
jgi:transposase InsO family protein